MNNNINKIFPYYKENINKIDFFCFPSAGSSAAMYNGWLEQSDLFNFIPIEYPGHGVRLAEDLVSEPNLLVNEIVESIINLSNRYFVLFGHSVGVAIILEVIKQLKLRNQLHRLCLVSLSGRPETSYLPSDFNKVHQLPDKEFIEKLTRYQGIPKEILADKSLFDIFLPIIRNDFKLNYNLVQIAKIIQINKPLITFSGQEDPDIKSNKAMKMWSQYTDTWLGHYSFCGGHFYLKEKDIKNEIIRLMEYFIYEQKKLGKLK